MTIPKLSKERLAELAQRYPHESNQSLMDEFGVTKVFLRNKAKVLRWLKSDDRRKLAYVEMGNTRSGSPFRQALVEFMRKQGAEGVTTKSCMDEFKGSIHTMANALLDLTNAGTIHRVSGNPAHWFATQKDAELFKKARDAERHAVEAARIERKRSAETEARAKASQRTKAAEKRSMGPAYSTEQAILPTGIKITRLCTPPVDYRYQVVPGDDIPRVFSLVPVGVNPMTGRSWSAA